MVKHKNIYICIYFYIYLIAMRNVCGIFEETIRKKGEKHAENARCSKYKLEMKQTPQHAWVMSNMRWISVEYGIVIVIENVYTEEWRV